ncbi:hypothetical protein V8E52_009268 [Russula decolorans]
MSSLHSCRWDWCRFTTVLHDDFVEHVILTHIDKAEPVKRADISLIRQVEQGASGHTDSFMGDISNVTVEATGARSEAPQLSFTSGSTFVLPLSQQKQHATSSDGSLAGHYDTFRDRVRRVAGVTSSVVNFAIVDVRDYYAYGWLLVVLAAHAVFRIRCQMWYWY